MTILGRLRSSETINAQILATRSATRAPPGRCCGPTAHRMCCLVSHQDGAASLPIGHKPTGPWLYLSLNGGEGFEPSIRLTTDNGFETAVAD
jgi:hypothetical protein